MHAWSDHKRITITHLKFRSQLHTVAILEGQSATFRSVFPVSNTLASYAQHAWSYDPHAEHAYISREVPLLYNCGTIVRSAAERDSTPPIGALPQ